MTRRVWLALVAGQAFGARLDRRRAIDRGVRFLYQIARDPKNFSRFGEDYLLCFYNVASTSRDPALARLALEMGRERAAVWRRENTTLPASLRADIVYSTAFGAYFAEKLGSPNLALREQIRQAAARYSAEDYLKFDPAREPPPDNVPADCKKCSAENPRGAAVCRRCGTPLTFRSRNDIWFDAILTSYTGDLCGITLGAPYAQVIRWLPSMRPYRSRAQSTEDDFFETVYSVTHVVYTMNGYGSRRLSPSSLPDEFAFLKANWREAIAMQDPETLGEFLDTLKSFGLRDSDPPIRTGMDYLLAVQNPDGSWGDRNTDDVYLRYHPTWTAVDGLRDYKW
jgi:hypothetical protein